MPAESYDAVKTRLLVVDDDKKLCRLIKDYLEPLGYDVVTVHTGKQGLEKALAETFDDPDHSTDERRFITIGRSTQQRLLFVAHTDHGADRVRIISARLTTRGETNAYQERTAKRQ